MSDVRAVARGGALNLVGSVVYGIANFAFVIVVTRMLGAGPAGTLLVAIAVFTVARGIAVLGANTGLVRMVSRERALGRADRLGALAWGAVAPVAVASTVLAVVLMLGAAPIAGVLSDGAGVGRLEDLLRVVAPVLPFAAVYTALVQGSRGFDTMHVQVAIDKIATSLALPAVAVVAIAAGGGEVAVAVGWAAVNLAGFVAVIVAFQSLVRREQAAHPGRSAPDRAAPERAALVREFWAFSLPRALGQTCNVAVLWFDTLLVAAWMGATDAGIYAAGSRYLLIGTFTAEAVMQAAGPRVSGLLTSGRTRDAQDVVTEATVWQAGLITPVYLIVLVFAAPLLSIFGPEYVRAETALMFLAAGMLVAGLCGPADSVVLMSGRSRQSLANSAAALAVNIVGNVLLVPRYGISAAGAVWAVTLAVAYGLPLLQARRTLGITTTSRALTHQVAVATATVGAAAVLARIAFGATFTGLFVGATTGALAYAAVTWHWRDALALRAFVRPVPST
jgi:O-antigen/teichoic acid export membrane protein